MESTFHYRAHDLEQQWNGWSSGPIPSSRLFTRGLCLRKHVE